MVKLLKNHPLASVEVEEENWYGILGNYIVINGVRFNQNFGMELASVVVDYSYETLNFRCDDAIVNGIELSGVFNINLSEIDTFDIIRDSKISLVDENYRFLIVLINNYLKDCNVELNAEKLDVFKKKYIRNREEVIKHNIEYFGINCPFEYLDTDTMVNNDNDYIKFDDNTFLNRNWLEDSFDDLIEDGVLIEL